MSGRDDLIASVPRNRGAIQVRRREYKGHDLADVRLFYLHPEDGTLQPSPKGCSLKPHEIREVAAALLQIADAFDAEAAG